MINAIVLFAHFIFGLIVYTKKWQDENIISGLLNIGLIFILFAVGWSISAMIAKYVMIPEGLGVYYDRDSFSLTILSISEYFFYKMYYNDLFTTAAGKEKQ